MALARLQVIISPLDSAFKLISFVYKCLGCIFFSVLIISIGFTLLNIYFSGFGLLPTALCNIFYNPLGMRINQVSALVLAVL